MATTRSGLPLLTFSLRGVATAAQVKAPAPDPRALCLLSDGPPGTPAMPTLINTGLDLLIDGECGVWEV